MKKIRVLRTLVPVLAILIAGYGYSQKENEEVYPANIIVLLDLSDRVSVEKYEERAKEQVGYDKDNCEMIIEVFDDIVRKESYSNSKSKLRFFIPDQQGFHIDSEYKRGLRVFGKRPIGSVAKFDTLKSDVIKTINQLYGEVLTAPQANFTGADIWSWFKYEAKRHLDPEFRNYIICLSDGYLDFNEEIQSSREKGTFVIIDDELRNSDNWKEKVQGEYKLKQPRGINFGSFEFPVNFVMYGTKDRTYGRSLRDRDILEAYWEPWLESMGIKSFGMHSSDVEKEEIAEFLETGQ